MRNYYFTFNNDEVDIMGQPLSSRFVKVTADDDEKAYDIFINDFTRIYMKLEWRGLMFDDSTFKREDYGKFGLRLHLTQKTKRP